MLRWFVALLAAGALWACRDLPTSGQFGYADADTAASDAAAEISGDPHCGLPGWVTVSLDDGGAQRTVCAADYPVWGVADANPTSAVDRADGTFSDTRTTLVWRAAPVLDRVPLAAAASACDALAAGGFADWRLPTVAEALSLVDFSKANPAVALPLTVTPGAVAWTLVTHGALAWTVAFDDGSSALLPMGALASAWCVRADPWPKPVPPQRFLAQGPLGTTDNIATDTNTGLQWQATDSPIPQAPIDALGWCRNLGIQGHGWRRPTVQELLSILDRSGSQPTIAPGFFQMASGLFQTATFDAGAPNSIWVVDFDTAALAPFDLFSAVFALHCVREPCGDGVCAPNESPAQCPADCTARILIPGGTFWQGCDTDGDPDCAALDAPAHLVSQDAFLIDKTEVTVAQYDACVNAGVCEALPEAQPAETYPFFRSAPVNYVSWQQARTFCAQWRGKGNSVPTETHLEFAARGSCELNGSIGYDPKCASMMRMYPWGNTMPSCALASLTPGVTAFSATQCAGSPACGCGQDGPSAVGSYPAGASPYGVEDLSGNLAEWTVDTALSYPAEPQKSPWIFSGPPFVVRGGSFLSLPAGLRSTHRDVSDGSAAANIGFRCSGSP